MNITITDKAAAHIQSLLGKAPKETVGLRLGIKSTGCSGNSYQMDYLEEGAETANDDVIASNGVQIYIPKMYSWMLFGTVIDYIKDDLGNERFDFVNPNETGRCGCGESFHVEKPEEG